MTATPQYRPLEVEVDRAGAVGDGTTDDSSAIQAAIDSLGSRGGTVKFGAKRYRCDTGLTVTGRAVRLVGTGGLSSNEGSPYKGTVLAAGTNSMTLLTVGDGSTLNHNGPEIENINFSSVDATNTRLVYLHGVNRWSFRRCSFRPVGTGVGIETAVGSAGDCSWGNIDDCHFFVTSNGATAILVTSSFGFMMTGGEITITDGVSGIGVDISSASGNIHFVGVKADGGQPCYRVKGYANAFVACSWETTYAGSATGWSFDGTGTPPSGDGNQVMCGSVIGFGDVANVGITISSNATGTTLNGIRFSNLGTNITDNGSRTTIIPIFDGTTAMRLNAASAESVLDIYRSGTRWGAIKTEGGLMVQATDSSNPSVLLKTATNDDNSKVEFRNSDDAAAFVVFGNGQVRLGDYTQPTINKGSGSPEGSVSAVVGSLYVRTDGSTSTTLYVKESGTGNTGWKAVQTA